MEDLIQKLVSMACKKYDSSLISIQFKSDLSGHIRNRFNESLYGFGSIEDLCTHLNE